MEPITLTIDNAQKVTGLGRSKIYELIGDGKFATIKVGRRTLIKTASIREYFESLAEAA